MSNTIVFAIGTFGSKLLVFFLMPFYTRVLTQSDYGTMDLVVNTSNLLLPLVMVSINEAVMRFGVEKSSDKSDVFTVGVFTVLVGLGIFAAAAPFLGRLDFLTGYASLIYIYVAAASFHGVCAQFVRALGHIRLYAFEGIFNTLLVVVFNILFLVVFKWGVRGYVLSVVAANAVSTLFLVVTVKLWRYIKIGGVSAGTRRKMFAYCLPLIPTTMLWWITNVSDRYLITYFLDESINGLYAVSSKIPTVISLISGIFSQAWQLAAFEENKTPDRDDFYSTIFKHYQTVVFMAASGILLFLKPLTTILVSPDFYDSWTYAPWLICSVVFSCFVMFFSSFYMAEKKNLMSLFTTLLGAVANILLNILWIPVYGGAGAAFATFLSYALVFVVRLVDTRRFVFLRFDSVRFILSSIAVVVQSYLLLHTEKYVYLVQIGMLAVMFALNIRSIAYILYNLLHALKIDIPFLKGAFDEQPR